MNRRSTVALLLSAAVCIVTATMSTRSPFTRSTIARTSLARMVGPTWMSLICAIVKPCRTGGGPVIGTSTRTTAAVRRAFQAPTAVATRLGAAGATRNLFAHHTGGRDVGRRGYFFDGGMPNGKARGLQVNKRLASGHWITNGFTIPATDSFPAYEGLGVWGCETVAKTCVNTWVDTNDAAVRTDYGIWQPKEQLMTSPSKQSGGAGHFVDYRITEEFKGNVRVLSVYQVGMAKPVLHPLG